MTEYRLVHDGYIERLQYMARKGWWFIKPKWKYVPRPYYDKIWGRRLDPYLHDTVINTYNTKDMDKFKEKWPNIEDYFVYFNEEQQKLVDKAQEYWDEKNSKKGVRVL